MENEAVLPRTYEEFNEKRKESFMDVKGFKDKGGKLVGYLCTYAPLEIIDAAGAAAVGLCGTSNETVSVAETMLPQNLCPLIKSTYGFALSQKCPFTYFSDLIVGETTCDGKKKMHELLDDVKDTYVLHLPQGQRQPREGSRACCLQKPRHVQIRRKGTAADAVAITPGHRCRRIRAGCAPVAEVGCAIPLRHEGLYHFCPWILCLSGCEASCGSECSRIEAVSRIDESWFCP